MDFYCFLKKRVFDFCHLTNYILTLFNLEDKVDVGTSFPLSRFGKGEDFVNISFAIMGANSTTVVSPVV